MPAGFYRIMRPYGSLKIYNISHLYIWVLQCIWQGRVHLACPEPGVDDALLHVIWHRAAAGCVLQEQPERIYLLLPGLHLRNIDCISNASMLQQALAQIAALGGCPSLAQFPRTHVYRGLRLLAGSRMHKLFHCLLQAEMPTCCNEPCIAACCSKSMSSTASSSRVQASIVG